MLALHAFFWNSDTLTIATSVDSNTEITSIMFVYCMNVNENFNLTYFMPITMSNVICLTINDDYANNMPFFSSIAV